MPDTQVPFPKGLPWMRPQNAITAFLRYATAMPASYPRKAGAGGAIYAVLKRCKKLRPALEEALANDTSPEAREAVACLEAFKARLRPPERVHWRHRRSTDDATLNMGIA